MGSVVNEEYLSFFKGKRVLVTGSTGFKGSWLSYWLHELGADVVGYALPPVRSNDHFNLLGLNNFIHQITGDVRDLAHLKKVFTDFQPEFLFHLAAQPLVRYSYEEPKLTYDTNIGGAVNILEAIRATPSLRSVVFITSDKCYYNKEWVWGYRENDELGGEDPYSVSKAVAELIFKNYMSAYLKDRLAFGAATVRAGNVIGGGDWSLDRIVPDSIKALQEERPIILRNPNSTRPWQYVLEPLSGYLSLGIKLYEEPKAYTGAWNFGPKVQSVRSVRDLAERIVSGWGHGEIELQISPNAVHEAGLLQLNCDKARQELNWQARWDFDRTVFETVRWYHNVYKGKPTIEITRQQIHDYMNTPYE